MEKISLKIDDKDIVALKGSTILEIALANNIYIPHLCHHPDLKAAGSCRVCFVEIDNGRLVTSCRTLVEEGMSVKTKSPGIDKVLRPVIEMIIGNHHMDCRNCPKKGQCELQRIMAYMKIDRKKIREGMRLSETESPIDESNPFFIRNHNKCVLCGICVRTCSNTAGINAIEISGRGNDTKISTFGDKPLAESTCVSCGECVIRCPVGALVFRNRQRPVHEIKTVCPYCSVGCGVVLGIRENEIVNVKADKESPVNKGRLCVKGRFGLGFVNSPHRLRKPLIRQGRGKDKDSATGADKSSPLFKEVSWDEALSAIVKKLRKFKGDEFALIASTKCTNEEHYVAQKFARVVMGSNNIDTAERLRHGSTIAAMVDADIITSLSRDGQEGGAFDIEEAACILVAGANVTRSHPVMGLRIRKAVENGAKLIVISPKETDISRLAHVWMNPYPGTDLALIMGMCNLIVEEGLYDNPFVEKSTANFEDFKESLEDFSPGRVERITGVSRDKVEEAARIFTNSKPAAIFWSTGVTQFAQGTNNVLSLINLSILTGNVTHSSGLIPLWGQNNSLGACNNGCLPDFYPGYQSLTDLETKERFEIAWKKNLNTGNGLTLTEILDAALEGRIKALYIIGSDLISGIAPSKKVKKALRKAKFIVVQDIFMNHTAEFAHALLPAASFAEKDGTFTNTEGQVQGVRKATDPAGDSLPDWRILCELAKKLGINGFDFNSPEEIMSEMSSVTSGTPVQKEKFRFVPLHYKPPAEVTDIDYPLILIAEEDIYSGGFMSEKVEGLNALRARDLIYINPKDASDFEISDGDKVKIISRYGKIKSEAILTNSVPGGLVSICLGEEKMNQLVIPALDEASKTPEIKMCAIRIERIKALKKE